VRLRPTVENLSALSWRYDLDLEYTLMLVFETNVGLGPREGQPKALYAFEDSGKQFAWVRICAVGVGLEGRGRYGSSMDQGMGLAMLNGWSVSPLELSPQPSEPSYKRASRERHRLVFVWEELLRFQDTSY